ncbi:MAG: transcription antitermination protein NusB [Clostridia bacterium]|nr:transcription antitermination protein NusB [Clostridia bacterium]
MRKDARENAFKLIFESLFHKLDKELSEQDFVDLKKDADKEFFNEIISAFEKNKEDLQEKIESNLKEYDYSRVYRVDLALVYLALTEILFCKTPKAVAINEAVELSKKYSTEK